MALRLFAILIYVALVAVCVGFYSNNVEKSPTCVALTYCGRGAIQNALKQFDEMEAFADRRDMIDRISGIPRRCSCHPTCHYFGTCCDDAFDGRYHVPVHRDSGKNCLEVDGGNGARVIDACPFSNKNKTQQLMCEDGRLERKTDGGYPLRVASGTLPYAVSVRTKLTYKNKHCALCMGEAESEVLEWKLIEEDNCKARNRANCKLLQQVPKVGQYYGAHFLPREFYQEVMYLFQDSAEARTVCDIDLIDTCPRGSAVELSNLCTFSTTRIVQDMLTKKVYNNVYCARCNNVQFLTGCEDLVEMASEKIDEHPTTEFVSSTSSAFTETSSLSTSFTASSTSGDFVSSSVATSTATATTGTTSEAEGTTTSSTSTTSGPTTVTPVTDALNSGPSHPHGQQIIVDENNPRGSVRGSAFTHGTRLMVGGDNSRGTVLPADEDSSGEVSNSEVEVEGQSHASFPNGTVLVPDPDNPRGFAILPPGSSMAGAGGHGLEGDSSVEQGSGTGSSIPHGTRLLTGPEHPRGALEMPDNSESSGSGSGEEEPVAEEVSSEPEEPASTTRRPVRPGVLQRLINAVARN